MESSMSDETVDLEPRARTRNYGRWRAVTLSAVYLLMGLHVAHWSVKGRTLAPLELNELMYTLELGIVTAGFLFMVVVVVSSLLVGRFFCSWACHILALQDLCAWLLQRLRIRAKPLRSRTLALVPFGAMFYMFVWPQIARVARGEDLPRLHVASDQDPWASFLTDDFWRNLPGPWTAGLTFLVCGFVIVYLLGTRSFCNYVCPYGAVFALADRFAPGRIQVKGDCTSCGCCTAVCQSGVAVHEELQRFGNVVDPRCLKDLDCLAACPTGGLGFGFTKPALFSSWRKAGRSARKAHFSLGEEGLMAAVLLGGLLVFRGLYDTVPFLLSLSLGASLGYGAVVCLRLVRDVNVAVRGRSLKVGGRLTPLGRPAVLGALLVGVFVAHSGFVRYHEVRGAQAFDELREARATNRRDAFVRALPRALHHLTTCHTWGLWHPVSLHRRLAAIYPYTATPGASEVHLDAILEADPTDHESRLRLARVLVHVGRLAEAGRELDRIDGATSGDGEAASLRRDAGRVGRMLARALAQRGLEAEAVVRLEQAEGLERRVP